MATPVFCCGFECGVSAATAHVTSLGASGSFSTSTVRSGTRSLRLNPSAATTGHATITTGTATAIRVIRAYIRFTTLPTANTSLITSGDGNPGAYFKQSDSKIYPGWTNVATETFGPNGIAVTTGVWYRLDIRINITTNPVLVDVSVDGVAITQASFATAGSTNDTVFFGTVNSKTFDVYFDDLLVSATSGDYPIGAGKVEHFVPTADGTHNIAGAADFRRGNTGVDILNATTTAFQLVDDVPLPSGAVDQADCWLGLAPANPTTDYVEGLFGPAPGISVPTLAPRAVEVILAHHQIATTVGQMTVRLNDNGTVDDIFDTGAAAGVTTYRYARKHYAAGPAGAWVIGGGGNGDFTDLRCRFLAQDANPDQCLDAIMIEAEIPSNPVEVTPAVGTVTIAGLAPIVSVGTNASAEPGVGTVVIAGLAPTVSVTNNVSVTPDIGTVVIAGLAPIAIVNTILLTDIGTIVIAGLAPTVSASDNKNITTDIGVVIIDGLAPTVSVTNNTFIEPGVGTVVIEGLSPTISTSDNKNITTDVGIITIAGLEPTVNIDVIIRPEVGEVIISGLAPMVSASDNKNITTDIGVITIEGLAPTVSVTNNISITPDVGVVVISGLEPTVSISNNISVTTDIGIVTIAGLAPVINISTNVFPDTGEVAIDGLAPTVTTTAHINIFPGLGTVIINGLEPSIGGSVVVSSNTGEVIISGLEPVVNITQNVFPSIGEVIIFGLEPTVNISNHITIQTDVGEVIISGLAPSVDISNHINVQPGIGTVVINGLAPTISVSGGGTEVEPGTGVVIIDGLPPTITTSHIYTYQCPVNIVIFNKESDCVKTILASENTCNKIILS